MKSPPSVENTPRSPRRRRALSKEEQALWESVAKGVKPLRSKTAASDMEFADEKSAGGVELAAAVSSAVTEPSVGRVVAKKLPAPPPLAPIGRRERAQLSKGRKDIDARLDLHGLTQARAHRALLRFLQDASSDGMSFVLVITGKGRSGSSESERGVLRRLVPEWLSLPEFRTLVVGFEEAHIGHGGAGALYVRVRRLR